MFQSDDTSNLIRRIYIFLNKGIKMWVENSEVNIQVPNNVSLLLDEKKFLSDNLDKIKEILISNGVKSNNYKTLILKSHDTKTLVSYAQERIFFLDRYDNGISNYNIPIIYKILGNTNLEFLENAIAMSINKNEVLRSFIRQDSDGKIYQEVQNFTDSIFKINNKIIGTFKNLEEAIYIDIRQKIDISNNIPIKGYIYKVKEEQERYLLLVFHHIAFDEWSGEIFLNEVEKNYNLLKSGKKFEQNDFVNNIQYGDFALWQRSYLNPQKLEILKKYWLDRLDLYEDINLPVDYPRPKFLDYHGDRVNIELTVGLSDKLRNYAKNNQISLFSLMLGAYFIFLKAFTSQNDLVVGIPVSGRDNHVLQKLIGLFVNTIAIQSNINSSISLGEYLKTLNKNIIESQKYSEFPFEKLVDSLKLEKDTSRNPIFQVMFGFQNTSKDNCEILKNCYFESNLFDFVKFDLETYVDDSNDKIKIRFLYRTALFKKETVESFLKTYLTILEQISLQNSSLKINHIKFVEKIDQFILKGEEINFKYQNSILETYYEIIQQLPDKVAIEYNNLNVTFLELDKRANKLALYIKMKFNIKRSDNVLLILRKSEHTLFSIIAILKLGAAYTPINNEYPKDRIVDIIKDSSPKLVITDSSSADNLQEVRNKVHILNIDDETEKCGIDGTQDNNPNIKIKQKDLAYVIYTSGSTGTPKGILITQFNLINYFYNIKNKIITHYDVVDLSTNIAFDLTVTTSIVSICSGAKISIYNGKSYDINNYIKHLTKNNVSFIKLVPAYFELLLDKIQETKIQNIILGGEKLSRNLLDKFFRIKQNKNLKLYDEYGPTEATVGCYITEINSSIEHNVGKPYTNSEIYILDDNLNILPNSAIGELCIGGAGISLGYLNNSSLTSEKFIANPYNHLYSRLYRTGDLARILPNGNIEYIGRKDSQIKLRGYRIELGEIEYYISSFVDINSSIVIKTNSDLKKDLLVCYYTSDKVINEDELVQYLQKKLSAYMIPSFFIRIREIPLTINSKVDFNALPKYNFNSKVNSFLSPKTPIEKGIIRICSEILGVEYSKISLNDDFFKLGGDSLSSIQLMSKIRNELDVFISLKELFELKTLNNIVLLVSNTKKKNLIITEGQDLTSEKFELSPIQRWFFDNNFVVQNHWNQSFVINILSADEKKIIRALNKLVQSHEIFKLKFKKNQSSYKQFYDTTSERKGIEIIEISGYDKLSEKFTSWQCSLDIDKGNLYKIVLIKNLSDNSYKIFFTFHHLLIDSFSWRIIFEDLKDIYFNDISLVKTSSYRQWLQETKNYYQKSEDEKIYWHNVISDYKSLNYNCSLSESFIEFEIDERSTNFLLNKCNYKYNTNISDLLITAFCLTIHEIFERKIKHITLESHGRGEISERIDISRTIGWFTTMFPFKFNILGSIEENIKLIKNLLKKLPNNGIGFGQFYNYIDSLPEICFNYLGNFTKNTEEDWNISFDKLGDTIHLSNQSQFSLGMDCYIKGLKLKFIIRSKFGNKFNYNFKDTFSRYIGQIIDSVKNAQRSFLTSSDIDFVIDQDSLDQLQEINEVEQIYLSNNLQNGIIFNHLMDDSDKNLYKIQLYWEYNTKIDEDKFYLSAILLLKKYPGLRTRFSWDKKLIQIIAKDPKVFFKFLDLSYDLNQYNKNLDSIKEEDYKDYFSLNNNVQFRIYLIKINEEKYGCLFSYSHAILDGWSAALFINELNENYYNLTDGNEIIAKNDEAFHKAQVYFQTTIKSYNKYWEDYIAKIEEKPDLGGLIEFSKRDFASRLDSNIESLKFSIASNTYKKLQNVSKSFSVTINSILLYAWHKTLSLYGNSDDTIVGVVTSGRNIPIKDIENSIGVYVNTVPIHLRHRHNSSVLSEIKKIQEDISNAIEKANIDLSWLQKGNNKLFDSLFVYENYPEVSKSFVAKKLGFIFIEAKENIDYPISIRVFDNSNEINISFNYDSNIFIEEMIKNLLEVYKNIITQIIENCNLKLYDLTYLPRSVFRNFTKETICYLKDGINNNKTIIDLLSEPIKLSTDSVALVFHNKHITYHEIDRITSVLAKKIILSANIKVDDLVSVYLDRSELFIIAIISILKSGGAYLPLDTNFPAGRVEFILQDAKPKLIISNNNFSKQIKELSKDTNYQILNIEDFLCEYLNNRYSSDNSYKVSINSSNLAYVMYTSGSTGIPKGVLVEHRSLVNIIQHLVYNTHDFSKDKKIAAYTPFVFDVSCSEFLTPLISGGELHILSDEIRNNIISIKDYYVRRQINYIYLPPALLSILPKLQYKYIKKIIYAGDRCEIETGKYWSSEYLLYNYFGPTETTIFSTVKKINNGDTHLIGRGVSETKCYILSKTLDHLPVGAVGELYIGGIGVARGYLNKPDLTAEKFIANPFEYGRRIYKTGDLARLHIDGNIEYLGRNDYQVKLRGYRVELKEIELAINRFKNTLQSIVKLDEINKQKYLVCYYTSESNIDIARLKENLKEKLPYYSIPDLFIKLDKFPLNINGKIDRSAFPKPSFTKAKFNYNYKNEVVRKLIKIWTEVLSINEDYISYNTNFFDIGGNSILTIMLISELNKNFTNKNFKITDIFKYSTIKSLSNFILEESEQDTSKKTNNVYLTSSSNDIAVIGMSGAFSGSKNIDEFFQNILAGKEGYKRLEKAEYNNFSFSKHNFDNPNYIPVSGLLDNIYGFDSEFWDSLSEAEIKILDPQIRKLLEHCWMVLENSGLIRKRKEKKIGLFAGMSQSNYYEKRINNNDIIGKGFSKWEAQTMVGPDYLTTRISYLLGLTGPSINIYTACSTSLVAIVEACKSLILGSCDVALAGASSIIDPEEIGYIYKENMIYSKDGHCRVFDSNSSGIVPGSTVAVVALKRLEDAEKDNDSIISVIKGFCSNNDGSDKVGYTAPSVLGQKECIINAQKMANITPDTIGYMEAHGTGTRIGDPIEIRALDEAFSENAISYDCKIGSVKANIGHADAAAGIAGFIKVSKMLDKAIIPPQINYNTPNPGIKLEKTGFKIITKHQEWLSNDKLLRGAVSSFGIGGTNAHIILEEYKNKNYKIIEKDYYVIPFSAKSKESLIRYIFEIKNYINNRKELDFNNIEYTQKFAREKFKYRASMLVKNANDFQKIIDNFSEEEIFTSSENQKLSFMFPGQGSQYHKMSKNLYEQNDVFRNYMDQCFEIIKDKNDINFKDILFSDYENSSLNINHTQNAQLSIFMVSYSLSKFLEKINITPDYYIGHSIGEYVAATLAGVFNLSDAIQIVSKRGELMSKMPSGKMLSVHISYKKLQNYIDNKIDIAAYNSKDYYVLSGAEEDIQKLSKVFDQNKIINKILHTSHAFHSKSMMEAAVDFEKFLEKFALKEPNIPFISNITGDFIKGEDATSKNYWARHIIEPVKFSSGIEKLIQKDCKNLFLEVGASDVLTKLLHVNGYNKSISALPSIRESKRISDIEFLNEKLGKLWCYGVEIDWNLLADQGKSRNKFLADFPNYQFSNKEYKHPYVTEKNTVNLLSDYTYSVSWQRVTTIKNFEHENDCIAKSEKIILFFRKTKTTDFIYNKLKSYGYNIISIYYDEQLKEIICDENKISINPFKEEHFEDLAIYLMKKNLTPKYIFHAWNVTEELEGSNYDLFRYLSMYSIYFIQNCLLNKFGNEIYFAFLANGLAQITGKEIIHLNKSFGIGAIRSLSYENSKVKTIIFDIGFSNITAPIVNFILDINNYINEPFLALLNHSVWREVYTPLYLKNNKAIIKNGDTILITGGTGGVGLAIAEEISKNNKVNIILIGKNEIASSIYKKYNEYQLSTIASIRNNGSKIDIRYCDITNIESLSKTILSLKEEYESIDEVIHSASSLPLVINDRTLENMENNIKSKVIGAKNLVKIFSNTDLKFFALMSSLDSLVGGIGVFEYCCANSYLDILSYATDYGQNFITINWPNWSKVGMNLKFYQDDDESERLFTIEKEEGARLFCKIINQSIAPNRLGVSKIDIEKLKATEFHREIGNNKQSHISNDSKFLVENNGTEMQVKLAKIFSNILGNAQISKNKSFFSLGGNSLSAIKLISLINNEFKSSITLAEFYANNKILDLENILLSKDKNNSTSTTLSEGKI